MMSSSMSYCYVWFSISDNPFTGSVYDVVAPGNQDDEATDKEKVESNLANTGKSSKIDIPCDKENTKGFGPCSSDTGGQ